MSLVLCVASVLLWLSSHWHDGSWNLRTHTPELGQRVYSICLSTGSVQFSKGLLAPDYVIAADIGPGPSPHPNWQPITSLPRYMQPFPPPKPKVFSFTWEPYAHRLSAPGIFYDMNFGWNYTSLTLSWWLIAALSAVIPLAWTARFMRSRRASQRPQGNLCHSCGYDLRASNERCPECGTPIPPNQHAPHPVDGFLK